MILVSPPLRNLDQWGEGHYGASRGSRIHQGIDLACVPGSKVYPHSGGIVTKLGYPYGDDLTFRYVEITTALGYKERYFYVDPLVAIDAIVHPSTCIGVSQKLGNRYANITEHIHFEIKHGGGYINPSVYLAEDHYIESDS